MPFHAFPLFIVITLSTLTANSQHLFGNPNCSDWQKLPAKEKLTWLNAYLVPLNLTNVSRKKPRVDKFSQLNSLDSGLLYVDDFCAANTNDFASVGAIRFLDELTMDIQKERIP
jgi:hypothetical protein